jgi:DNA primase
LSLHEAYDDPNDPVQRSTRPVAAVDDPRKYTGLRHPYLWEERHLTNETLDRYEVGYNQERLAVTIPIYDKQHALVGYKERRVDCRQYNEVPITEGRAFFGIDKIKQHSIVWLCEGEFDAMYVDQCLRNALVGQGSIALSGRFVSEEKLSGLVTLEPLMFVDALDNDEEGRKASAAIRLRLEQIAPVMRMDYEDSAVKDPNESSPRQIVHQAYRANAYLTARLLAKRQYA